MMTFFFTRSVVLKGRKTSCRPVRRVKNTLPASKEKQTGGIVDCVIITQRVRLPDRERTRSTRNISRGGPTGRRDSTGTRLASIAHAAHVIQTMYIVSYLLENFDLECKLYK